MELSDAGPLDVVVLPQARWRSRYQLRVGAEGIEVRVPAWWSVQQVAAVQHKHRRWVAARQAEAAAKLARGAAEAALVWCPLPEAWWRKAAKKVLPQLVAQWANTMGVRVTKLRYTGAKTRWGSCTAQGVVSLSWRLLTVPWPLVEYVVVHELAHRRVFDHSPRFWAEVGRWLPDYEAKRLELRQYAARIT